MIPQQRLAHGLGHQPTHVAFVAEFHLALRGMNVHVHFAGIDFEEEAADREAALHQRGVIALGQREVQAAVFDGAAVDEDVLFFAGRARDARRTDEAPQPQRRGLALLQDDVVLARGRLEFAGEIHGEKFVLPAAQHAQSLAQGGQT